MVELGEARNVGVSKGQPGLLVVEEHSDALLTVGTVIAQEQ